MGKKSLRVKIDNLSEDEYIDVAHEVAKTVKSRAPNSDISIVGADSETFESSSRKEIKGK
ncbi:MAG TPA: hypothetical protein DCY91_27510 [Cyanobacteria bacterium UBA11370]|nr:hypothetical protein [Cyanobacteria bacterium UBA11370]HBY81652.1 hypothetical protein [Cyanobacteria bacterium UBA11148]